MRAAAAVVCLVACKSDRQSDPMPEPPAPVVRDAAVPVDAAGVWPELADYPVIVRPERTITLPARPDVPRFEVGGPVLAGDLAIVASSQFGFIAVDWRRGAIAWTKPSGTHVAPPVVRAQDAVLVGECVNAPAIGDRERLLGCVRVVTFAGADQANLAIRGNAKATAAFAAEAGTQDVWLEGEQAIRWRRGDQAVVVDLLTGVAKPAPASPPPLVVTYKDHRWEIVQDEGRVVAREHGKIAWQTEHPYTALLGTVWLPEQSPMLRIANLGAWRDAPEIHLLDIDATGSLHAQAAKPSPGIQLLGWGVSPIGDAAIAIRLDTSLRRDFIAGYAANAPLVWIYPLPEVMRPDPVGVAVAPDGVVVFHDGDTLTILPELSAAPTSPGAPGRPSKIPTP